MESEYLSSSEQEQQFRDIFEDATIGIYRTTPDGHILMANPAIVSMLGYDSLEELQERNLDETGYEPSYPRDEFKEKIRQKEKVIGLESAWIRRDGTVLFVRESAHAVYDDNGQIKYYEGTVEDITERKAAEEKILTSLKEKELLLREIHHRVKNNLQVIHSLLDFQLDKCRHSEAAEAIRSSRNRIKLISIIHDQLYQYPDLSEIDLELYLNNLINSLVDLYGVDAHKIEISLNVDQGSVEIDTAIPCSMIINELISNAIKHAFPEGRGKISVDLSEKNSKLILTVRDDGIGLPEHIAIHDAPSVGLQLVDMLVRQIGGSIKVERNKGTVFIITCRR